MVCAQNNFQIVHKTVVVIGSSLQCVQFCDSNLKSFLSAWSLPTNVTGWENISQTGEKIGKHLKWQKEYGGDLCQTLHVQSSLEVLFSASQF